MSTTTDKPTFWDFDKDGPEFELQFKGFESAQVNGREVVIAEGKIGGVDRSVFLWPEGALFARFKDHIARRPSKRIDPGETIHIRRGEKRPSKTNPDRQVWEWTIDFLDAPPLEQKDFFGLGEDQPEQPPGDGPVESDDDIPFMPTGGLFV
jgi:hypothetical protein